MLGAYDFTIYSGQIRAAAVGLKPVRGFAFAWFKIGAKDIGVYSGNHGLPDATFDFIPRIQTCRLALFSDKLPSMEAEIDDRLPSNSRYMLSASTCAIAASIVLLASCSVFQPVIDVVPVGSLQHGVVFYLGDIFRQRQEFTVTAVAVREEQSDGSTRAVWSADGAQRLRYITYGATYPDLKESQRPLRLRRGKRYGGFRVH